MKDLAVLDVKSCSPETDLATAARIMWDCDCGAVPVVSDDRKVLGMVTDRDICIAAATRAARPSDIRVADVMSRDVAACRMDDDVRVALKTMKAQRLRRLPVLDAGDRLAGILSMNDLALHAECRPKAAVSGEVFLDTLRTICAHTRVPQTV